MASPSLTKQNGSADFGPEPLSAATQQTLLKKRAYTEIKQRILRGDLPPTTFLSERQLAAQLAMSKTPVRAALARLELEGFVSISPQQGVVVRDLSVHDIADQYEIRIALETYVVRALAGRLTPAQIARLRENLSAQEAHCDGNNVPQWVELDATFHLLLCEFLGNQEILRVMGQLREKIHRITSQVFQLNPSRIASSYREHRGIANAVIKGEAALVARRIEEHLERGKRCLLSPRDVGALPAN
jgi:DNA-binding GntR family transcriptional regulator